MTIALFAAAVVAGLWAIVRARAGGRDRRGGWSRLARVRVPEEVVRRLTPPDAEHRLARAGIVSDGDVVGRARAVGTAAGMAVGAAFGLIWPPAVVLAIPGGIGGAALPGFTIRRASDIRGRQMRAALPQALDLLAICVTGGMALDPALAALARQTDGPLSAEISELITSVELGLHRRAAYERLVERCPCAEVGTLVAALRQSEELGAPLAPALLAQAKSARDAARRAALERAASAAPKIQLVTAVVLVPAAMLLIVATLLLQLGQQIGAAIGGTT